MMTTLLFVTLAIVNAEDTPEFEIPLNPILGTYTGPEADKEANLAKALATQYACRKDHDLDDLEKLEVLKAKPLKEQHQALCDAQNCLFTKWEDDAILGSDGVYSGDFALCESQATQLTCEIDCTRAGGAGEIFVMPILTLLALLI